MLCPLLGKECEVVVEDVREPPETRVELRSRSTRAFGAELELHEGETEYGGAVVIASYGWLIEDCAVVITGIKEEDMPFVPSCSRA